MKTDAQSLIDEAFDPLITYYKLKAVNAELSAAREIIASGKSSTAQKNDARATLFSAGKDQAELLLTLTRAGLTGGAAYATGIANLKTSIDAASGPMKVALQGVLDKIIAIEKAGKVIPINYQISVKGHAPGKGPLEYAAGGVVPGRKGEAQLAIVHGGETVVPTGQPGYTGLSAGSVSLGGSGSTSGSPVVFNYNVMYSTASTAEAQRFAQAITPELTRELLRQSIL
jgi:hypothetical protein